MNLILKIGCIFRIESQQWRDRTYLIVPHQEQNIIDACKLPTSHRRYFHCLNKLLLYYKKERKRRHF